MMISNNVYDYRPGLIDTQTINLKLHNCCVYFNQKINPWGMVFYFFILLLRLLSYKGFKFVVF